MKIEDNDVFLANRKWKSKMVCKFSHLFSSEAAATLKITAVASGPVHGF